jgi:hypothetical protein
LLFFHIFLVMWFCTSFLSDPFKIPSLVKTSLFHPFLLPDFFSGIFHFLLGHYLWRTFPTVLICLWRSSLMRLNIWLIISNLILKVYLQWDREQKHWTCPIMEFAFFNSSSHFSPSQTPADKAFLHFPTIPLQTWKCIFTDVAHKYIHYYYNYLCLLAFTHL